MSQIAMVALRALPANRSSDATPTGSRRAFLTAASGLVSSGIGGLRTIVTWTSSGSATGSWYKTRAKARTRGFRKAILHAQLTAEGFYLKEGFSAVGGVFDEAGIAHRKMERAL